MAHKTVLVIGTKKATLLKNFESDCNILKSNDQRFFLEDVTENYMKDYISEKSLSYYDGERCYLFPSQTGKFYEQVDPDSKEYKKFFYYNKNKIDQFIPENRNLTFEPLEYIVNNDCDLYKKKSSIKIYMHKAQTCMLISFKDWFLNKYKYETTVLDDISQIKDKPSGEFFLIENKENNTCSIIIKKAKNRFDYIDKQKELENKQSSYTYKSYQALVKKYYKEFRIIQEEFLSKFDKEKIKKHNTLEDLMKTGKYFSLKEVERFYRFQDSIVSFNEYLNHVDKKFSRIPFELWINSAITEEDLAIYAFPDVDVIVFDKTRISNYFWKNNYEKIFFNIYARNYLNCEYLHFYSSEYKWLEYTDFVDETLESVYGIRKCKEDWRRFIHKFFEKNGEVERASGASLINVHC